MVPILPNMGMCRHPPVRRVASTVHTNPGLQVLFVAEGRDGGREDVGVHIPWVKLVKPVAVELQSGVPGATTYTVQIFMPNDDAYGTFMSALDGWMAPLAQAVVNSSRSGTYTILNDNGQPVHLDVFLPPAWAPRPCRLQVRALLAGGLITLFFPLQSVSSHFSHIHIHLPTDRPSTSPGPRRPNVGTSLKKPCMATLRTWPMLLELGGCDTWSCAYACAPTMQVASIVAVEVASIVGSRCSHTA